MIYETLTVSSFVLNIAITVALLLMYLRVRSAVNKLTSPTQLKRIVRYFAETDLCKDTVEEIKETIKESNKTIVDNLSKTIQGIFTVEKGAGQSLATRFGQKFLDRIGESLGVNIKDIPLLGDLIYKNPVGAIQFLSRTGLLNQILYGNMGLQSSEHNAQTLINAFENEFGR